MRVQSVRFGDRQWALIVRMAELEGVSAAQFIRDAANARALVSAIGRDKILDTWISLVDALSDHPELLGRLEQLAPSAPARPRPPASPGGATDGPPPP